MAFVSESSRLSNNESLAFNKRGHTLKVGEGKMNKRKQKEKNVRTVQTGSEFPSKSDASSPCQDRAAQKVGKNKTP